MVFRNLEERRCAGLIAPHTIKLTLWNEQIDQVKVDDVVKIENGYVTSFRGEIQLNAGKYGKLSVG